MQSLERKGPHKSMHCEFCKPPGTAAPEGAASPQLETKTKLHLTHEGADLQVFDVFDEPASKCKQYLKLISKFLSDNQPLQDSLLVQPPRATQRVHVSGLCTPELPAVESEICICQVEGQNSCPKCSPDKNRKPVRKKICDCPSGSKPVMRSNVVTLNTSDKKKKKKKRDDQEFWWEKYDREHDAKAKETWAAYLAQRKEDKRLAKQQEIEYHNAIDFVAPLWYQKLSCQQAMYLEYLSTAIRLDLDENIIDRTSFVLGGIGLYPRPKRKVLHKCLRYCHYNAIQFLDQLFLLIQQEDPFNERFVNKKKAYSWNDRIIMSCMCYLEFPKLLREIMSRLPPLPREQLLPSIPEPSLVAGNDDCALRSPYEEPLWIKRLNWTEKQKLERINRTRKHMDTKRVKIPALTLVVRPSLIDARPPFLSQIVASQSFNRKRDTPKKETRGVQKRKKATFNSKTDVTAIVGIEASEVSTTPKADSEEVCVFLREERSKSETAIKKEETEGEYGDEEFGEDRLAEVEEVKTGVPEVVISLKSQSLMVNDEEFIENEDSDDDDNFRFVTPPKTESGATIEEPCPCPKSSPAPPAEHYDLARKELGVINEELCFFDTNEIRSINDDEEFAKNGGHGVDVDIQLQTVVKKLKDLSIAEEEVSEDAVEEIKIPKKKKKKCRKCKKMKKTTKQKSNIENDTLDIVHNASGYCEKHAHEGGKIELEGANDISVVVQERKKGEKYKKKGKKGKRMTAKRNMSEKRKAKRDEKEEEIDTNVSSDYVKMGKPQDSKKVDSKSDSTKSKVNLSKSDYTKSISEIKASSKEAEIFYGDVNPLLNAILEDLREEGFISASYEHIENHPDIKQLLQHLRGEIITNKLKKKLNADSKEMWKRLELTKGHVSVPKLKISNKKYADATWSDKKWVCNLTRKNKDEYYFNIGKLRSDEARNFFRTLQQEYFGTERFLKMYYAYMIAKYEDCILKGLF